MTQLINSFAKKIQDKNLTLSINLDRPEFVQPEDRLGYRSCRLILILGMLNTTHGLSKEVIACMDFLLRNSGYQKKFIVEYFKENKNLYQKMNDYKPMDNIETDFNIVQYKSVPWDLRFNDMFLYLKIRKLIQFKGKKPNLRIILTEGGIKYFEDTKEVFTYELNFLELFGKSLIEDKATAIITEVIPDTYWKENDKSIY